MEYIIGGLYRLAKPIVYFDKGKPTTWDKDELFLLADNKDKKVGPCFVALKDNSLLSLKVVKKLGKTVMLNNFEVTTTEDETDAEVEKSETLRDMQAPNWPRI